MSARDDLFEEVLDGLKSADFRIENIEAVANELIDAFAHELAEQIREYPRKRRTGLVGDMAREIQADFHAAIIDPEVRQ